MRIDLTSVPVPDAALQFALALEANGASVEAREAAIAADVARISDPVERAWRDAELRRALEVTAAAGVLALATALSLGRPIADVRQELFLGNRAVAGSLMAIVRLMGAVRFRHALGETVPNEGIEIVQLSEPEGDARV